MLSKNSLIMVFIFAFSGAISASPGEGEISSEISFVDQLTGKMALLSTSKSSVGDDGPAVTGRGNYKSHGQVPGTNTTEINCGLKYWKTCWRLYPNGLLTAGDAEITIGHFSNHEPIDTEFIDGNEVHTTVHFYE